jgi:hypothetical protein
VDALLPDALLPDALPKDDWCHLYREEILPLIDEEAFRPLYAESGGRPNAPVKVMVSLLIFMGLEKLAWRAAEYLFPRRLDWMIATNTASGEAHVDHTTLFKFFQRLEGNEVARELFTTFVEAFVQTCGTSLKKQRTDSFFVHGWLRLLSRYGLFKETVTTFLRALRKHKPGLYENIRQELSQDYLEDNFDLTEKDKELARRKVALMARDLYRIKGAFENHHQVRHYDTFEVLCRVFTQQCQVEETPEKESEKESAKEPEITLKEKPDTDTICTPHNPEARYVRKGKQRVTGDKAVITETCDPDNKMQFITDVDVVKITTADSALQPELLDRQAHQQHIAAEMGYILAPKTVATGCVLDSHDGAFQAQLASATLSRAVFQRRVQIARRLVGVDVIGHAVGLDAAEGLVGFDRALGIVRHQKRANLGQMLRFRIARAEFAPP